ncbi:MAG: hypothetical protein ACJAZO_003458 [Myxococcota bacterium]|jgi:hypothetical protein
MSHVTVFLRTALFSLGGDNAHVPAGTMVLKGTLPGPEVTGSLALTVSECLDLRGKSLATDSISLILPMSKVDHILLTDA